MNTQIQETIKFIAARSKHKKFGIALIAPNCELGNFKEIKSRYEKQFEQHNAQMMDEHYNAGVDIMAVNDINCKEKTGCVEFGIMCEILTYNVKSGETISTPYQLCARSSLSKKSYTPAIGMGVIDNNFRGHLKAFIKKDYDVENIVVKKYERLFQLTHPKMYPILAFIVDEKAFKPTNRGEGGFGSTGVF